MFKWNKKTTENSKNAYQKNLKNDDIKNKSRYKFSIFFRASRSNKKEI